MEFLATCRGLHTQHGMLPGYDIALQVYKKGEAIAYSNLPSVGSQARSAVVVWSCLALRRGT